MIKKEKCEKCKKEFDYQWFTGQKKRRFCSKKCWYEWNARKLATFNESRFQWNKATEEQKLERLKHNFNAKVVKKEGCWDWKGVRDKDGYGLIPGGYQRQKKAHRVSFLLHKGAIPDESLVCHDCDNPICTNPEHLFLGSKKENDFDSRKKGRACVGSKQPRAKLNEMDVKKIKYLLSLGVKARRIAKDFGVAPSQICEINKGRSWKHVKVKNE